MWRKIKQLLQKKFDHSHHSCLLSSRTVCSLLQHSETAGGQWGSWRRRKRRLSRDWSQNVPVTDSLRQSLKDVIINQNISDPFLKMFWSEQTKAFRRQNGGMRWHLMLFAILVHSQSPSAYNTLQQIGALKLSGESTLRDYTNAIHSQHGFNSDVIDEVKKATALSYISDGCSSFIMRWPRSWSRHGGHTWIHEPFWLNIEFTNRGWPGKSRVGIHGRWDKFASQDQPWLFPHESCRVLPPVSDLLESVGILET